MATVNIDVASVKLLNVLIGQQDENKVNSIVFDFSAWVTAYGSGTLGLAVKRSTDTNPYDVAMTVRGSTATWSVSDTDTMYKGQGYFQLTYTVNDVVKKSVVHRFTVYESLGATDDVYTPDEIKNFVQEITELVEGFEAELTDVKADLAHKTGLSEDAKQALLACFQQVAWIGDDGQDYYDALEEALYPPAPPATLLYITCVYTQSGTVYDTDSLDSLKTDLVVTAHMSDSTTRTVTAYALSGTLTEGTSTITVAYDGKTTTFNVTVSSHSYSGDNEWYNGAVYKNLTIVPDEYVKSSNGQFTPYTGWSRTVFVYCEGASSITFPPLPDGSSGGSDIVTSSAWYTRQDTASRISNIELSKTMEVTVNVPSTAKYFAISSSTSELETCIETGIVPHA